VRTISDIKNLAVINKKQNVTKTKTPHGNEDVTQQILSIDFLLGSLCWLVQLMPRYPMPADAEPFSKDIL
jgi:hypothetical protein